MEDTNSTLQNTFCFKNQTPTENLNVYVNDFRYCGFLRSLGLNPAHDIWPGDT
jgi:hypothetical protein